MSQTQFALNEGFGTMSFAINVFLQRCIDAAKIFCAHRCYDCLINYSVLSIETVRTFVLLLHAPGIAASLSSVVWSYVPASTLVSVTLIVQDIFNIRLQHHNSKNSLLFPFSSRSMLPFHRIEQRIRNLLAFLHADPV